MLEILKSKAMMGFAVVILGILLVHTNVTTKLEENEINANKNLITMNVQ